MRPIPGTILAATMLLTSCAHAPVLVPATRVVYKDVVVQVQRPCPAKVPKRPDPLAKPLPTDLGPLLDVVSAKLEEWAGKGAYGEKADAALKTCTTH